MSLFGNSLNTFSSQAPFASWQREMNDLLDRFNRGVEFSRPAALGITPNVEMTEDDKSYHIYLEVPGMKETDLNVSLKENDLIIEGKRTQSKESQEAQSCSTEFLYGDIYRAIPLDEEVNANTVKASYKDGILIIVMDKLEPGQHKVKKIPILKS